MRVVNNVIHAMAIEQSVYIGFNVDYFVFVTIQDLINSNVTHCARS